jgi:hypothetical protein
MATLAIAAGFAAGIVGVSVAAETSAPRGVAHYSQLTGTIVAVDHRSRSLELLTGVGHALRVTRVHLPVALGIRARGGETPLAALTPGCIVRVACRSAASGTEASSIELLQPPEPSRSP